MNKQRFSKAAALFLAVLMVVQTMSLPALAADDYTVVVLPKTTQLTKIDGILTEALLGTGDVDWEFYSTGKTLTGSTNTTWGDVAGFTSSVKVKYVTTYYTHTALSLQDDGYYNVRYKNSDGDYVEYKIYKQAEQYDSSITLNSGASADLGYNEDGSLNESATKANIFDAVVASTEPELTAGDVTIKYKKTAGYYGEVADMTAQTYDIKVSYSGTTAYKSSDATGTITMVDNRAVAYTVNETIGDVTLSYTEDNSIDYDALKTAIFNAVGSSSVGLTANDVTIQYKTYSLWKPLEGETIIGSVSYPAMTAGEGQQVKITWDGNSAYKPVEITATINVVAPVVKGDAPITLATGDVQIAHNAANMSQAIIDAVVTEGKDLDGLNIQYKGENDDAYTALTANTVLGVGSYTILVTRDEDDNYKAFSGEKTITVYDGHVVAPLSLSKNTLEVTLKNTNTVEALETAILGLLTVNEGVDLDISNATVEYDGEADLSALLNAGEYTVTVSWPGNNDYHRYADKVTVKVVTGQVEANIVLIEGKTVYLYGQGTLLEQIKASVVTGADEQTEITGYEEIKEAGTYDITVTRAADENYYAFNDSVEITVEDGRADPADKITLVSGVTIDLTTTDLETAISGNVVKTELEGVGVKLEDGDALSTLKDAKMGEYTLVVSREADDAYLAYNQSVTVSITRSSSVKCESATVNAVYSDATTIDGTATKAAIFGAVVKGTTPAGLTADQVTIEYKTETKKLTWSGYETTINWTDVSELTATGTYTVKVSWSGNDYYTGFESGELSVTLVDGRKDGISLKEGQEVAVNAEDLETAIFEAIVQLDNGLKLTAGDVTIQYNAAKTSLTEVWVSLNGGKSGLLTYSAISEGEQTIKISWDGNATYKSFEGTVTVNITSGKKTANVQLNSDATVSLTYKDASTVDYDQLKTDIFKAVVTKSEPELTADNVTIKYYATAVASVGNFSFDISTSKAWADLTGGTVSLLTYPAISEGSQKIQITWEGNDEYDGFTEEVTVTIADREALVFNLTGLADDTYEVGLVFGEDQGIDYDATAEAIYNAVVASTEPAVDYADITVQYDASYAANDYVEFTSNYQALSYTSISTKDFGEGTWSIKISWPGSKEYAGSSVTVTVKVSDNRLASAVVLKDGVSFTYNMDIEAMKQEVFDNVIDWDSSTLPDKDTLSVNDFTFTYKAEVSLLEGANSGSVTSDTLNNIWTSIKDALNSSTDASLGSAYVPFEGQEYTVSGVTLGSYPHIGAGEQTIQVVYNGNADYKASAAAEGTVTINMATVKVSVKSTSVYVSAAKSDGLDLVTLNPNDPEIDVYTIYAGITSNVTTAIYLDLPDKYVADSTTVKVVDAVLEGLGQKTLTEMMTNGMTVSELRALFNADGVLDALALLGVDTSALQQVLTVVNKLPSIGGSIKIAFGQPTSAGVYTVTAVSDNSNYKTAAGVGALVLKADKATLSWKQSISKISTANAKTADFSAVLKVNGVEVSDQSSVHVLYSGVTSKFKVYSSTTTAPTEPGRYVETVVILGGDYVATPITRSFQITK